MQVPLGPKYTLGGSQGWFLSGGTVADTMLHMVELGGSQGKSCFEDSSHVQGQQAYYWWYEWMWLILGTLAEGLMAGLWTSGTRPESIVGWSCFRSAAQAPVSGSATGVWGCLLRVILYILGLYQSYATSYLVPKLP